MFFDGAAVAAQGLTVQGGRGCPVVDVTWELEPGALGVVAGPGGSGRTSLLLTLAGRMRPAAGRVAVGRHRLPGDERRVREAVALAQAPPAVELDGLLRVRELIRERRLIDRTRPDARMFDEVSAVLGVDVPDRAFVADLPPDDRVLFAVALAAARMPAAVVVDDADAGVDPAGAARVWRALRALADEGCTVIASSTAAPGLHDHTPITLPHPVRRDAVADPSEA